MRILWLVEHHTREIAMTYTKYAVLIVSAVLSLSCSSEDSGTGSHQGGDTLLATADIGPSGGSLDAGDIAFTIPESTLATTVTLSVYSSNETTDIGVDGCSDLFYVQGLPGDFNGPIGVRIATTQALVGASYIIVSNAPFKQELGNHAGAPLFIEAVDSAGYLIGEWFSTPQPSSGSNPKLVATTDSYFQRYIQGMTKKKPKKHVSHFVYHWSASLDASTTAQLEANLEHAYDDVIALGVSRLNMAWPMHVYSWDFVPDLQDRYCLFLRPEPSIYVIAFDAVKLREPFAYGLLIGRATMRELFHSVLASNDPNYFLPGNQADPDHYWFHHAFASWSEERIPFATGSPIDYIDAQDNIQAPLNGMKAGRGTTMRESLMHGGGMSAMAKYLVENYQESILLDIYAEIRNGSQPVPALLGALAPYNAVSTWYPDFIKEHTRGALYTYSIRDLYDTETWDITSTADTSHTFALTMPDLAAKVCEVKLSEPTLEEVSFSLSSGQVAAADMQIIVHCDRTAPTDPYLTSAGQQVTITDINTLRSQGITTLYAVVVNSSQHPPGYSANGTISVKVDARMKDTLPVFNYNTAEIWLRDITYDCYEEWKDATRTFQGHHGASWKATGAFDGYTFTGFDSYAGSEDWVCSTFVSITIDPETMRLSSFEAAARCGRASYKQITNISSVPGMELPFMNDWSDLNWQVGGSPDVCGYFAYEGLIYGYPPQYDHWYSRCTNSACIDEGSQIWISIFNEDPQGVKTDSAGTGSRGTNSSL